MHFLVLYYGRTRERHADKPPTTSRWAVRTRRAGYLVKYSHPNIHHYIIGGLKSQARSSALFKRLAIRSRVKRRKAEHIIIEYSLAILWYCYHALTAFIAISQRRRAPWRVPDFSIMQNTLQAIYIAIIAFIKFFGCKGDARSEGAERLRKFSEGAWTSRRVWCVCVRTPQKPR